MYTGLQHLHSYFAYLLLAVIVFVIVHSIIKLVRKRQFTERDRKIALSGFIATHLQLLFGLVLYVISPVGLSNFSGEAMQQTLSRIYVLEHPLTMLIAVILISVGYIKAKKPGDDARRYKTVVIYYAIGLFLILLRIPWAVWP